MGFSFKKLFVKPKDLIGGLKDPKNMFKQSLKGKLLGLPTLGHPTEAWSPGQDQRNIDDAVRKAGGGASGREGDAAKGTPGMMNGGVLGPSGLMGSPAEMEAQSRQLAQTKADWASRPDQTDMYGNQLQWSSQAVMDPATGQMVNKWSSKLNMDPLQQQAIDSEKNIKAGMMSNAQGLMGRVGESVANPMDFSKFQQWGAVPQGDDQARQRMEGMLMDRMRPEHEQQQANLEAQVRAMGLTRGMPQWNREMQRLGDQQSRAKFDAFQTAGNEMTNQFNRELSGANYQNTLRGSQISEEERRRLQPLAEMNALRQGNQVQTPQFNPFTNSQSAGGTGYVQEAAGNSAATQANRASIGNAVLNAGTTLGSLYYNQPAQPRPVDAPENRQTTLPGGVGSGANPY